MIAEAANHSIRRLQNAGNRNYKAQNYKAITRSLAVALLINLCPISFGQGVVPVLQYNPPPNFYHSAITPPDDFSSSEVNGSIQVYPFRPFTGNIEQAFQQSLLRDWIDPRYRESNLAGRPEIRRSAVRGAQTVLSAGFFENVVGIPRPHLRLLVVAGGFAALVDASSNNMTTWQRILPAFSNLQASLRIETEPAPPDMNAGPGPGAREIAGLYMGTKPKFMVNLNGPVGSGSFIPALHYYLFSPSGQVYRAYDQILAPAGDIARFDFAAAQRRDPGNTGRYVLTGHNIRIQMSSGQAPEVITAPAPRDGQVVIGTVRYVRQ
jgi:hypothetical protein